MFSRICNKIFQEAIELYHKYNDVNFKIVNHPYKSETLENLLFEKCYIDTVQWHLEDLIRDETIEPQNALKLKRRIDSHNQKRCDIVEQLDDYFLAEYGSVKILPHANLNTESPAWAIDRLSILALKIYHMERESIRDDATEDHKNRCKAKLYILKEQRDDLSLAIDILLEDIQNGRKYMKVYRQMKMYNDADLNPVLYKQNKEKK